MTFSEAQCKKWVGQIISTLGFCHEAVDIAHGDIRAENVYIDLAGDVVLKNFKLNSERESKVMDVYAVGVTLYGLIFGHAPHEVPKYIKEEL